MTDQKHACLIYVSATEGRRAAVRARLEQRGYVVCETEAELDDALAAQAGATNLPAALADCITKADLCVFLLPESEADDCALGAAAGLASQLAKHIIGVVAGAREKYPEGFEDDARSMVREDSDRLDDAICGTDVWERPDRSVITDRPIDHIRCQ